jgi:retrograde regulation protein 2
MMKLPKQLRESNPLHALAPPMAGPSPSMYDSVLQKLSSALPPSLDLSSTPTILSLGLGPLWASELWTRQGHDADTNGAFSLHNALVRDSDCPGFSHLTRAILAVASVARWGCKPSPTDAAVYQGLTSVAELHHPQAPFWACYIGALSGLMATVFPVTPLDAQQLDTAIRFKASHSNIKANIIELDIAIAPEFAKGLNIEELISNFKVKFTSKGDKKNSWKVIARLAKW